MGAHNAVLTAVIIEDLGGRRMTCTDPTGLYDAKAAYRAASEASSQ